MIHKGEGRDIRPPCTSIADKLPKLEQSSRILSESQEGFFLASECCKCLVSNLDQALTFDKHDWFSAHMHDRSFTAFTTGWTSFGIGCIHL